MGDTSDSNSQSNGMSWIEWYCGIKFVSKHSSAHKQH